MDTSQKVFIYFLLNKTMHSWSTFKDLCLAEQTDLGWAPQSERRESWINILLFFLIPWDLLTIEKYKMMSAL